MQLFVSDLHLKPERPDISRAFLHFLDTKASKAQQLYLLGDIFEAWIGDDAPYPGSSPIIKALKSLSDAGVEIYFQHGNRDFLVGQAFAEISGCQLLAESIQQISPDQHQVLVMHGDQLCTDDQEYMQFRKMVRSPEWQQSLLSKSVEERLAIASKLRDQSQQANSQKSAQITDVNQQAVEQSLTNSNCRILLHGHTHRPNIHHFTVDNIDYQRIVLGDWDEKGWYLQWDDSGYGLHSFQLKGEF